MNVAIIGCGGMGRMHAQMAHNCGFKVVSCVDKELSLAKKLAKAFDAHATHDTSGAIRRPDVDAVCITTPTPRHSATVTAAAKAGKHIFCEKPFGRTMQQCRSALNAVKRAKVKLFVGHVVRYFQEFETMKAQLEAGKIGTAGFTRIYRGGIFPGGPGSWFHDYQQSGGVILDTMIHDLDWVCYVFGKPVRIFGQALRRTEPEMIDYGQVTMTMESGLIASFTGTWAHPQGFRVKAEICGDGGMLQFDSAEAPIATQTRASAQAGPTMIVPGSPMDVSPYQLEWADFKAWLEEGREPRVTPDDAVRAVEIALGALKSADTGKPVKL